MLCDRKMTTKLNWKKCRTVVRPALVYRGIGTVTNEKPRKETGGPVVVNEMRMLRWMCGVTKKDEDAAMDVWSDEER